MHCSHYIVFVDLYSKSVKRILPWLPPLLVNCIPVFMKKGIYLNFAFSQQLVNDILIFKYCNDIYGVLKYFLLNRLTFPNVFLQFVLFHIWSDKSNQYHELIIIFIYFYVKMQVYSLEVAQHSQLIHTVSTHMVRRKLQTGITTEL